MYFLTFTLNSEFCSKNKSEISDSLNISGNREEN